MEQVRELCEADKRFIEPYLPASDGDDEPPDDPEETTRPFVTLTYACSMDGMISLAPGVRTTLSGLETKSMTHYLRLHHDAILVGVGTAVADDPSLNCRYPGATLDTQPRPLILDPDMRWDVKAAKLSTLAAREKGKTPWMIHNSFVRRSSRPCNVRGNNAILVNEDGLADPWVGHQPLPDETPGRLEWRAILKALKQRGINSVMVEGGATVINDLLKEPEFVDSVIVTIAPTWLGQGGVVVSPEPKHENEQRVNAARLTETVWRQFGEDAVLCGRLKT